MKGYICLSISLSIHWFNVLSICLSTCLQNLLQNQVKSSEIQWYNSMKTDNIHKAKKNIEKKIAVKSRIVVHMNLFKDTVGLTITDLLLEHAIPETRTTTSPRPNG